MPYIDANALRKIKFHPLPYQYVVPSDVDKESYVRGWNDVIDGIIETMPTADVDVQKVVLCRDCKHGILTGSSDERYCWLHRMCHFEDYYCADGKRKKGGAE